MPLPSPSGFLRLAAASLLLAVPPVRAEPAPTPSAPPVVPAAGDSTGAGTEVAPPRFANDQILLTAEQSTGGKIMKGSDGKLVGVTLDRSCAANFKKGSDACIEWKLGAPLPAGWWHGTARTNMRPGYANRELSFVLVSTAKPAVALGSNTIKGQVFEFWIYSSTPVESVRIQPSGDLWHWNNTWPVSEIALEHRAPAALTAADAITMDLPAQPSGSIPLPVPLPAGLWSMSGVTKTAGTATFEAGDGALIRTAFDIDYRKTAATRGVNFYTDSPLRKVTFEGKDLFKSVLLKHNTTSPPASFATADKLTDTVDPAKSESARLVMTGVNLTGEAPALTLLPKGDKTAVVTTWDDGAPEDLRCAEILHKYGYHPSFFLNQGSAAMKFLDKLEALNVEIGSHGYHHSSLYAIAPQQALEECAEIRKVLENTLKHPVISYAYPNGYTPAYDARGDYVLRAVKAAGYWSGRTTRTKAETVDSYQEPAAMDTDGFFGNSQPLEAAWAVTRTKTAGIFYFWGHSWQIGKTDEQWKKFEDFVAQFANQPDTWYASQGDLSLWLWARKNLQIAVESKSSREVVAKIDRPWLHPYLSARLPLSFTVPAGVQKVVWQGREVPVSGGRVDVTWTN